MSRWNPQRMYPFFSQVLLSLTGLALSVPTLSAATLFSDEFSDIVTGTAPLSTRQADVGSWAVISGTPQILGQAPSGAIETQGGGRVFDANFTQSLGAGQVMQLKWNTLESAGVFANGYVGFQMLLANDTQVGFVGSTSATANAWEIARAHDSTLANVVNNGVSLTNGNEAAEVTFSYAFDTGLAWLTVQGGADKQEVRTVTFQLEAGLAVDSLRFVNNSGGDMKFSALHVDGASQGVWKAPSGSSWGNAASWAGGSVPSGAKEIIDFGNVNLTSNHTVTLDGLRTAGHVVFGDIDTATGAVLTLASGTSGVLNLNNGTEIPVLQANNGSSNITAQLSGTNGFVKTGVGTITLNSVLNAESLRGSVRVSQGLLGINDDRVLGSVPSQFKSDALVLNGGGLANMTQSTSGVTTQFSSGHSLTIHENRGVTLGSRGGTFRIGYHTSNHYIAVNSQITGVGGLTKDDAANLILRGANTYLGDTNVNSGTIYALNTGGSATGFGSFYLKGNVSTPTMLAGAGTVQGGAGKTIEIGQYGTLRVGHSHAGAVNGGGIAADTSANSLTLGNAALPEQLNIHLFGTLQFDIFGTGSDLLQIFTTGQIDGNAATLQLHYASTQGWSEGQEWKLIDWTGASWINTTSLETFATTHAGFNLRGDVRSNGFYVQIVPEPQRALLLALGLSGFLLRRRK